LALHQTTGFLYLGDSHREALASLYCGIEADRGFMVLIAPPGLGKTTLIFQLIEKLRPDARTVFLFQTQCTSRELIQFLLNVQPRISMFAKVEPFSTEETARYIAHRLKVAGYAGGELFTSGAMEIIKDRSKGVPSNINRLCFSALSLGCAMDRKRIDAEMMREVVANLDLESHKRIAQNNQLMLVPRISSSAETTDSPVISNPAASHSRLPGWALGWAAGAAGLAASMAIAVGVVSYSHGRYSHGSIGRVFPSKSAAATTAPNPSPSIPSSRGSAQAGPARSQSLL
jgi:hypothetical protein